MFFIKRGQLSSTIGPRPKDNMFSINYKPRGFLTFWGFHVKTMGSSTSADRKTYETLDGKKNPTTPSPLLKVKIAAQKRVDIFV